MNESEATDWVIVGSNSARFEAPDLIVTRAVGILGGPEAIETWKLVEEWTKDVPDVYWISDISRFEHYSGAALRAAAAHGQAVLPKLRGMVCIGGSYRQRTVMTVVFKAAVLLGMAAILPDFAFLDSENEARVFIDDVRRRRARAGGDRVRGRGGEL